MRSIVAALIAVFLCLPVYAQDDITPYWRHDAKTGLYAEIPLDTECLQSAGQRFIAGELLIFPWFKDREDWERAQTFAAIHCSIKMQRETNELLLDILDALTAE